MFSIEKRNAKSIDFPMYEDLTLKVKNVPCLSSFTIYRDLLDFERYQRLDKILVPYAEIAKNILADAAMQYEQTGKYTVALRHIWDEDSVCLRIADWRPMWLMVELGKRIFAYYQCSTNIADLRRLKKGRITCAPQPEAPFLIRRIYLHPLDERMVSLVNRAIEVILQATINYSRTRGQMIEKKIELIKEQGQESCKVEIVGEENGLHVHQICAVGGRCTFTTLWIDFPSMLKESRR